MRKFFNRAMYPTGDGSLVVLPAERFVVRRIPLARGADVREQVELAVESFAPLALPQLFWGYLLSDDQRHALLWVACRRHFEAGELQAWQGAAAVMPGQLLLCRRREPGPAIVLHASDRCVQAAAWDGQSSLPAFIAARSCAAIGRPAAQEEILAEARRRLGVEHAPVLELSGAALVEPLSRSRGVAFRAGDHEATYSWGELSPTDLRDGEDLRQIRRRIGHERLTWRITVLATGIALLAGTIDLAAAAGRGWLKSREREDRAMTARVAEIESAHALAHRLHELSGRKFRLMEMLDILNEKRPSGLRFVRAVSEESSALDVDIETLNADEVRQYEEMLRTMPQLGSVQLSNLNTREGSTRFLLRARFRPEALQAGGGAP